MALLSEVYREFLDLKEINPKPSEQSVKRLIGVVGDLPVVKWSCFLGQVCGLGKMHLFFVHAAFLVSTCSKYAVSGVRLSRAV